LDLYLDGPLGVGVGYACHLELHFEFVFIALRLVHNVEIANLV
jgi:hypothetical protein